VNSGWNNTSILLRQTSVSRKDEVVSGHQSQVVANGVCTKMLDMVSFLFTTLYAWCV